MKLKNRNYLSLVVREYGEEQIPIAAFLTFDRAEEYAGVMQQEFVERNIDGFVFKAIPLIYYDM